MSLTYFRSYIPALSYREVWYQSSGNPFLFVIGAVVKTLRIDPPSSVAFADHEGVVSRVTEESLSPALRRIAAPMLDQAHEAGAGEGIVYVIETAGPLEGASWLVPVRDRDFAIRIIAARLVENGIAMERVRACVETHLSDGRILITSRDKPEFDPIPGYESERLVGRPLRELIDRHRERLTCERVPAIPLRTGADLERITGESELRCAKHFIARGVWKPLTSTELETLRRAHPVPGAPAHGVNPSRWGGWVGTICLGALAACVAGWEVAPAGDPTSNHVRIAVAAFAVAVWLGVIAKVAASRRRGGG